MPWRPIFCLDRPMLPFADPLSQVLSLAGLQAATSIVLNATGPWSVSVKPLPGLKCTAIRHGSCWLENEGDRWHLHAGDCFLVAPGLPFVLATDLTRDPQPAEEVFADCEAQPFVQIKTGSEPELLCLSGRIDLPPAAELLIESLPPVTLIPAGSAAALRVSWLLDSLEEEHRKDAPGKAAMTAHITQMVFIELLRALPRQENQGWLAALSDPRIAPALKAIHARPGKKWRLDELAALSHLSRSQFAARFRAAVGWAPIDYLLHWRMVMAQRALTLPGATVAAIATEFGYSSESAFGVAYRRVTGTTPRRTARTVTDC